LVTPHCRLLEALPPAGSRFVYRGPVVSGAHRTLAQSGSTRMHWFAKRPVNPLRWSNYPSPLSACAGGCTPGSPLVGNQRSKGSSRGDRTRIRDCRALVEAMNRHCARLEASRRQVFALPRACWAVGLRLVDHGSRRTLSKLPNDVVESLSPRHPVVVATLNRLWQPGYLPPASTYCYGIYPEGLRPWAGAR